MHKKLKLLALLAWFVLAAVSLVPIGIAATSPYLVGRELAYIVAGFAGICCLSLLLFQPLLAAGYLPGLRRLRGRRWHRWLGSAIILAVFLHVAGLYLTSAPDTIDALLLVSPTPFSVYGVIAMWGVIVSGVLVALRHRHWFRYRVWRIVHNWLALITVIATVVHALLIEGTMGAISKLVLCICILIVTGVVLLDLRVVRPLLRKHLRTT